MIKGLIFDLSSDEKTVRTRAIRGLIQFASHDGVEEAVRKSYEVEEDSFCRQGLEEILEICDRKSGKIEIQLVGKSPSFSKALNPEARPVENRKTNLNPEDKIASAEKEFSIHPVSTKAPFSVSQDANQVLLTESSKQQARGSDSQKGHENSSSQTPTNTQTNKTFKEKLEAFKAFARVQLEWAANNNLNISGLGLGIILIIILCIVAPISYNTIMGSNKLLYSGTLGPKKEKVSIPGEFQTEAVQAGEILKGTLKEYDLFGQIWFFLADDGKLFKMKLQKSPGFYKIKEKLRVQIEACEKNSLGQTVLIGKVAKN